MDNRLKGYYERELRHLRESAGEFAEEFPKIAGRLGLSRMECADPYVERLLEGFAYLASRVQLKLDAEFPRFTQHLLESVYPQYLSPRSPRWPSSPSSPTSTTTGWRAAIASPGHADAVEHRRGENTPCYYTTAHDEPSGRSSWSRPAITPGTWERSTCPVSAGEPDAHGLRLSSKHGRADVPADRLDTIDLFLTGGDQTPMRLYELLAQPTAVISRSPGQAARVG